MNPRVLHLRVCFSGVNFFSWVRAVGYRGLKLPISAQESEEAIEALKLYKAPDLDSFTSEFYNLFTGFLSKQLQMVFQECLVMDQIPPS